MTTHNRPAKRGFRRHAMTANTVWAESKVPNGPAQFFATAMVIIYMQNHYRHWHTHQQRVLAILAARQKEAS